MPFYRFPIRRVFQLCNIVPRPLFRRIKFRRILIRRVQFRHMQLVRRWFHIMWASVIVNESRCAVTLIIYRLLHTSRYDLGGYELIRHCETCVWLAAPHSYLFTTAQTSPTGSSCCSRLAASSTSPDSKCCSLIGQTVVNKSAVDADIQTVR